MGTISVATRLSSDICRFTWPRKDSRRNETSPWNETEVEMKTLVSAIALLVGSNVLAVAGDQTLKFKLVAFYVGDKDGESHMVDWNQGLL
jgi:hypothetical protein